MKFLKTIKILSLAALALLLVPSLIQTSSTPRPSGPRISYNPSPGDIFHAPLSSMGLIGFAQARPEISGLTGSSRTSTNTASQLGPQTISQNALRFITDTSYFPQTETAVSVDPSNTNHVLGGFNDLKFFFCQVLPSDCFTSGVPASISGFTVSVDGGSSVLKSSDIQDISPSNTTTLFSSGDPSVAASVDGNFFYGSLAIARSSGANGVMIAKSNPNLFNPSMSCVTDPSSPLANACWTAVFVAGNLSPFPATFEDKPLIAVDHNKGKFFGSVYIAWDHFNIFGQSSSYLARCDNGLKSCTMLAGGTLPPISGFDQFAAFTTPTVDRDGNVAVAWCNYGTARTFGPVTCKVRSSPAGGASFGGTSAILSFMGPGTTFPTDTVTVGFATEQFRTFSVPSLAVDASPTSTSGNLYFTIQVCTSGHYDALISPFLAGDNPGNCGLSSILFSSSTNGGSTWSSPAIVSQPAVNVQPYVTVDSATGQVFIVYYTTQFDPFNHRIDVVASRSTNGGSSFTQERVTSVSNEPDSDPSMFFYLSPFGGSWVTPQYGDYFQATAIGGTLWVLFTANYAVEAGTFQTDPFLAVLTHQ